MKEILNKIFHTRFLRYLLIVSLISVAVGMFYSYLTRNKNADIQKTKTPEGVQPIVTPDVQKRGVTSFGNATDEKQVVESENQLAEPSSKEKAKILPKLPIYIEKFKTSNSKSTTINIFSIEGDSNNFIRVEVYGVNYNNASSDENNPDYIAFRDSFAKAKEEIKKTGADPDKLIYIFYTREYIHSTAEAWARYAGLISY
jgi:hypothetical protein